MRFNREKSVFYGRFLALFFLAHLDCSSAKTGFFDFFFIFFFQGKDFDALKKPIKNGVQKSEIFQYCGRFFSNWSF